MILLNLNNFDVKQFIKLRREIAAIKPAAKPKAPSLQLLPAPKAPEEEQTPEPLKLQVVNTSFLGVAMRDHLDIPISQKRAFAKLVTPGPLAVLTLPSLDPPQLSALIRVLQRAVPPKKPPPTAAEKKAAEDAAKKAEIDNPTPGRRVRRPKPDLPPELEIRGALIEGRLFMRQKLDEVAKLPNLDTLRAQILGLISSPAAQIVGVLNSAGGAQLARTLDGFRRGLEMAQEQEQGGKSAGDADAPSS
ncbi:hypothetical protein M422DRAFT_25428 [Sphaerobolus stellatus SS14]|nr:hypothetical protein M422DRAFT_25428 [Sphaerobolus stellatus SS14]